MRLTEHWGTPPQQIKNKLYNSNNKIITIIIMIKFYSLRAGASVGMPPSSRVGSKAGRARCVCVCVRERERERE